ncbi:hypothetical protein E4U17_007839 [Claviceps sp. LM77 group G4]|nr:hypothetical protein E4U17_007839 [Claviceps sp. LM77 group G4]KAG6083550.1 hypothetical protein E4U16_003959 [Claviceps sp. LM84 group G4]KAG6085071.1 hypothetical protein E4U33_002503 [Claviceps sp. LM78 group G4]
MSRPTFAMAGAFPLVESSSMEYTTTEDKIVYLPGAPRLGELVPDDLVVVRPGRNPPEEREKRLPDPGKKYTIRDVRLVQSRPWEWHTAAAEEEMARRLAECDDWPVMVPEDDEGQAWIEVPECDKSTEWTTDVFRTHMIEAARQREVALGFLSDLLATVAMQNGHIEAMAKHTNRITQHSEMVCQDLHELVRVLTEQLAMGVDREANKLQTLKEQFIQNVGVLTSGLSRRSWYSCREDSHVLGKLFLERLELVCLLVDSHCQLFGEKLPKEYWYYADVFSKVGAEQLPPRRPEFDHKIRIAKGHSKEELPFRPCMGTR